MIPPEKIATEKFSASELSELREGLLQSGLDSRQVAELIRGFLAERGYGVSHDAAYTAAISSDMRYGTVLRMQEALERLAVFM